MRIPTLQKWFVTKRSASAPPKDRSALRVGMPKVLNVWSTHQFWLGFLTALGIRPSNIVFSADTSEAQSREFGKGRGTVDCCYPVKCLSGHYGQLVFGQKNKIDILLVLGRPYHMDPGIGHEIEVDLQSYGYPILWTQYFPLDEDFLDWLFGQEIRAGRIRSPFDIADVWVSSYSGNTNEILWGAKAGTRCPWTTCVIHLSSYECGMDQPTYTPVQKIVEASGTLYFKFGDLDATKPAGGIKIRVQTIAHYLDKYAAEIMARKLSWLPAPCPF